ncbi:MAG: hypothetical protein WD826_05775 [Actinomycetota bacterium]
MRKHRVGGIWAIAFLAVVLVSSCAPRAAERTTAASDASGATGTDAAGPRASVVSASPVMPGESGRRGAHAFRSVVEQVPDDSVVVAPHGRATNDGSWGKPLDLRTALRGEGIEPGDVVLIRGGTYSGSFQSLLEGTADYPIQVAAFPGDRVVIDGGTSRGTALEIKGAHTRFQGFEVRHSLPAQQEARIAGGAGLIPGNGIEIGAPGIELVDFVVHDNATGVLLDGDAIDAKIVSGAIYHNGYRGPGRRSGHGIEIRNKDGTKVISQTLVFSNFGDGINIGGFGGNDSVILDSVFAFDNGIAAEDAARNLAIGSTTSAADRIRVTDSVFYHRAADGTNVELGSEGVRNGTAVFSANDVIGGEQLFAMRAWSIVEVMNNSFIRPKDGEAAEAAIEMWTPRRIVRTSVPDEYRWDRNTYTDVAADAKSFVINSHSNLRAVTFEEWQEDTDLDAASTHPLLGQVSPTARVVPVEGLGRANIAVINPGSVSSVRIDLAAAGLERGTSFEIRDAQNLGGPPVASGTFDGSLVTLQLERTAVTQPTFGDEQVAHTPVEFGTFVLTRR